VRHGRAGDAFDTVGPSGDLADLSRFQVPRHRRMLADVAADPFRAVDAASNHDAVPADDPHHAAGRQSLGSERVLETFHLGSNGNDRAQLSGFVLDRACHRDHQSPGCPRVNHVADRTALTAQYLLKEAAVADVDRPQAIGGGTDVLSIQRKDQDVVDEIRQLIADPVQ
jgi:hypothetical protein